MPSNRSVPNPLTVFRLLVIPLLWLCAVLNWQTLLGYGLLLAALSDALDGSLAKRYPQFTNGKFDSLADKLLSWSVMLWLLLLKTELLAAHIPFLLLAMLIYFVSLMIGWRKFRRVSTLHLHSGKVGGLLQAGFVLHAFLSGSYNLVLFYLAVGSFIFSSLEEMAIQLVYTEIDDEQVRSIWPYLRHRWQRLPK